MQTLLCPRDGITGLNFSPDGDMLAGTGRKALYCWPRSRGWEQTGLRLHGIGGAVFHPDGLSLAYLGQSVRDGVELVTAVRLYSLTEARHLEPDRLPIDPTGEPPAFAQPWLRQLAFTPDGRALVTNQFESRGMKRAPAPVVLYWHLTPSAGGWRVTGPTRTAAPVGAALVGESAVVLVGLWGARTCPLDPAATTPLVVPDLSSARVVAAAPRGELVAAGALWVKVWHLRTAGPVAGWKVPQPVPALCFAPDGRTLAVGAEDGSVAFVDPLTGRTGAPFDFGVGPVRSLAYAPDGLTLAVAGRDGLVVVDTE